MLSSLLNIKHPQACSCLQANLFQFHLIFLWDTPWNLVTVCDKGARKRFGAEQPLGHPICLMCFIQRHVIRYWKFMENYTIWYVSAFPFSLVGFLWAYWSIQQGGACPANRCKSSSASQYKECKWGGKHMFFLCENHCLLVTFSENFARIACVRNVWRLWKTKQSYFEMVSFRLEGFFIMMELHY